MWRKVASRILLVGMSTVAAPIENYVEVLENIKNGNDVWSRYPILDSIAKIINIGSSKRNLHAMNRCSIIYSCHCMEANQVLLAKKINEDNVVHAHHEILFGLWRKETNSVWWCTSAILAHWDKMKPGRN